MRNAQRLARLNTNVRALHRRLAYLESFVIELSKQVLSDKEMNRTPWPPPPPVPPVRVIHHEDTVPLDATGFLAEQRLREMDQ